MPSSKATRFSNEGREAYARGDYQQAVDKYTPGAADRCRMLRWFADRRQSYIAHLSDASVALAMQHRKVGKYAEARTLLEGVLAVDPNNGDAKRELGYLDDPIRTNPALTYEHTQNVDKVRRALYTAEGNFNLGKYDDAKREYENVAPHRSLQHRRPPRSGAASPPPSPITIAPPTTTPAPSCSMQVDAAWELSVPADAPELSRRWLSATRTMTAGVAYITEKLRRIIIPRIDFEDTTVEEAIDFLRLRSAELDTTRTRSRQKGRELRDPPSPRRRCCRWWRCRCRCRRWSCRALPAAGSDPGALRVRELRIRNVPLAVALKYICDQTKLRYKVDDFAVTLVPQTETGEDIFTRTFRVPPDFQRRSRQRWRWWRRRWCGGSIRRASRRWCRARARSPQADHGTAQERPASTSRKAPPPLSAPTVCCSSPTLRPNSTRWSNWSRRVVNKQPKQVKITTKFVEISQENNDELGFDWIVSPFGLSATRSSAAVAPSATKPAAPAMTSSARSMAPRSMASRPTPNAVHQHRHQRSPQR